MLHKYLICREVYLVEWKVDGAVSIVEEKHFRSPQTETIECGKTNQVKFGRKFLDATVISIGKH